ncbi:hypothetical protein EW145_g363 [Phellinidium pouzarii]|uniref:Thioredoxin domain-containing protein n=1 Tax=Phellinidium pouzarii TaxID=167371 RepID=A0A4S4LIR2_9AGAM|nr:hypothetical protein EW145_g363 [Phellinidium pouzarii]
MLTDTLTDRKHDYSNKQFSTSLREPGCLGFRTSRFGDKFNVFEEYVDSNAVAQHFETAGFKALVAADALTEPPSMGYFEEFKSEGEMIAKSVMSITRITSTTQLDGILSKAGGKLTVIDFHATWCGPCKTIAPTYEDLARRYTNVNFLKCDVDEAQEVAQRYRVTAMPTFVFLKNSSQVGSVRGADAVALKGAVERYSSGASPAAFAGKGQTLGGSSPTPDIGTEGIINLTPQMKVLLGLIGAYVLLWYFS